MDDLELGPRAGAASTVNQSSQDTAANSAAANNNSILDTSSQTGFSEYTVNTTVTTN